MDKAGTPPTHEGTLAEAFPKFFQHTCMGDPKLFLVFSELLRCRFVCRDWQRALNEVLPTSRWIGFRPYQANVTGEVVLKALKEMTGANRINQHLKTVDLRD